MKFPIRKVFNDGCSDNDEKPIAYFGYEEKRFPFPKAEILEPDASSATLEELVELCDQHAESCNSHSFCGAHRILGAVLYRQNGRESATKTMLFIAERGGLHRMSGDQVLDSETAYEELGVGKNGHDWDGSYSEGEGEQ